MTTTPFIGKGIKYGLVMGAILIIIDLTLYIVGGSAFMSVANFTLNFLAVPLAMVLCLVSLRRSFFGHIPYWMAVVSAFLCCFLIVLVKAGFNFVMYNFVDPSLGPALLDKSSDGIIELMELFRFSPARIEQFVDNSRGSSELWSLPNSIRNLAILSTVGLILSLILGVIFRRKRRGSYFR